MKPGGKLLLVEPIIQPGHNSESAANKFLDLQMLINSAGRERTAEEFAHLFETSGFKLTGVLSSSQTGFSILEGISV